MDIKYMQIHKNGLHISNAELRQKIFHQQQSYLSMLCPVHVICVLLQQIFRNRSSSVSPGCGPAQIIVLVVLIMGFQEPGFSIMVLIGIDLSERIKTEHNTNTHMILQSTSI